MASRTAIRIVSTLRGVVADEQGSLILPLGLGVAESEWFRTKGETTPQRDGGWITSDNRPQALLPLAIPDGFHARGCALPRSQAFARALVPPRADLLPPRGPLSTPGNA
jgi:hypothetical protein